MNSRDLETFVLGAKLKNGDSSALSRVLEIIRRTGGRMRTAARELGVAHNTLCRWRAQVPALDEAVRAARAGRREAP